MKKERFNKAFNYLKGIEKIKNQKHAAQILKIADGNLSKALKGDERYLTDSFLERFNRTFGWIFNTEWLLTGDGEMLKSQNPLNTTSDPSVEYGNNDQISFLNKRIEDLEKMISDKEDIIELLKDKLKDKEAIIEGMKSGQVQFLETKKGESSERKAHTTQIPR